MSTSNPLIDSLQLDFSKQVRLVLSDCVNAGFIMRPFFGIRSPFEQARLWRQGRTLAEIERKAMKLDQAGATFLARVIRDAGPQHGRLVTGCPPGYSWHQYGLAIDCFLSINGEAVWDSEHPGYAYYAESALRYGLTAGQSFRIVDSVHVQQSADPVSAAYHITMINKLMEERYG